MNKVLIDTNAYGKFLSGNRQTLSYIVEADVIYLSVIVIGELYAGFAGGNKYKSNIELLKKFISKPAVEVLPVEYGTAEIFGEIKSELKKKGNPIPINDVWIAAHCFETGAKLLTFDRHFKFIPGIRIWEEIT
jgi:tRNA(fMet)-specific endonuclease VapC